MRVLVVDDIDTNRRLLRATLASQGIESVEAADGIDALEKLNAYRVDAVVADILMPRMDGYRLCYEVRQREKDRDLPFIIYSATYTSASDERLARECGADRFMRKPDDLAALPGTIKELARESAASRPVPAAVLPEIEILKEYSEALVRKLEERNAALEAAHATLQAANEEIHRRQDQKMSAISRLAGGIAHDFNNLLTAVIGNADLLLSGTKDGDSIRSELFEIRQAAMRAAGLTRRLLEFSSQQVVVPEVLDLNDLVTRLKPGLRHLISPEVEVSFAAVRELWRVRCDAGQLEQVITDLAINAGEAMPDGGTLTIGLSNAELDEAYAQAHIPVRPGSYVRLSVQDTGMGMHEEVRARVFEPFFTTKPLGKGTGLGLATVYGIVKQAGGYITLQSKPEWGTTFEIYLPRYTEPLTAYPAPPPDLAAQKKGAGRTILLVDDEDIVRRLAKKVLEIQGYTVLEAPGGHAALDVAGKHPGTIDLLLTDVMMPGMTGTELAPRIAASRAAIKIVFMSGYTDNLLATRAPLEAGALFLPKPFTPEKLATAIKAALSE